MSDLQIALVVLAVILLVVLYGWNKWQERRALRELTNSLKTGVGDPLMQQAGSATKGTSAPSQTAKVLGQQATQLAAPSGALGSAARAQPETSRPNPSARIEPRWEAPAPLATSTTTNGPATPTPSAPMPVAAEEHVPVIANAPSPFAPGSESAPLWVEDPLLDFVLELRCTHAVDGVTVFDSAQPLSQLGFTLPVFLVAWDGRTQQWVQPDRFGFYTELLVGVQLASRTHKLDEIEASRFLSAVQQVAMALDADVDAPEATQIVQLARDLDRLCARFDVQIGLTLESEQGAWDPVRIAQAAREAQLEPDNLREGELRWVQRLADGRSLFSLSSSSPHPERLVLELDVPVAPAEVNALQRMADVANQLAPPLRARVVDDNGRPISPNSINAIAGQLAALLEQMRVAGVEAGSPRALRLYQ